MSSHYNHINLAYLSELSGNDLKFIREMVSIFLKQIPEFLFNIKNYLNNKNAQLVAKEAHTAKSSVMVFMMTKTATDLKQIQWFAETNALEQIPSLLAEVESELTLAIPELNHFLDDVI